jgi:hypothetical protein
MDMKLSIFYGLEHIVTKHQMDDVVLGEKNALLSCEAASPADFEETFNLVRDAAHGHDGPGLGDGSGKGQIEPDRDIGER